MTLSSSFANMNLLSAVGAAAASPLMTTSPTVSSTFKSPVWRAFDRIQWDALGSLKLTAQETALLRMAETNPMSYTLADSRDASMYARVLLKLLAEAYVAGAGTGEVSKLLPPNSSAPTTTTSSSSMDATLTSPSSSPSPLTDAPLSTDDAIRVLSADPLGVVSHYSLTKLVEILECLKSGATAAAPAKKGSSAASSGAQAAAVTIATVFYVGKEGVLVDQWKSLLRVLNKGGKGDAYAQKVAAWCLTRILVTACPSTRQGSSAASGTLATTSSSSSNSSSAVDTTSSKATMMRPIQYASVVQPLEAITAWIVSQLKNASGPLVAICTPAMRVLMETKETRALFCTSGGVKYMARQLRIGTSSSSGSSKGITGSGASSGMGMMMSASSKDKKKLGQASVQQLYEIAFCLWLLTYDLNDSYAMRLDFAKDALAVAALVDLVSVAPREKVVRVALSSLRNLATCTGENDPQPAGSLPVQGTTYVSSMIACGLMKAIDHLRERQFTDPDLVEDVEVLHKLLQVNYKEMTRWEVYKNEVESGHLMWGSTHTEAFFKENARMMEGSDGDFRLVKVLIALLSTSQDEEVNSIACYDIGEFVRHYPNGRAIAKRLGAKELVMQLIEHENPELQRHALQCVSKIMVNNWEYVK